MSYKIVYDDLWELSGVTSQTTKQIRETIESLNQRFQSFTSDTNLQGTSIHNMKTYIQEVHGTLLKSLVLLLAEYETQLLLYKDGYFNIEDNLHAVLPESIFETVQKELSQAQDRFISQDTTLASVSKAINDLVTFSVTRSNQINSHFSDNWTNVQNLKAKVGEYEKRHEKDLDTFAEHLISLRNLVKYYVGQSKNVPKTYQSQDIAKVDVAKAFVTSYQKAQAHLVTSSQQLDAVIKREEGRLESLKQEAIESRKQQADQQFFMGLLIAAGGFIAIVSTAGAATPLVATIGVSSGAGTMLYGASQMDEAVDSKKIALQGDITSKAFNPLRDTIFFGNQEVYDFAGGTFVLSSTATSLFVAPVTNLMASGHSLFRAGGMVTLQNAGIGLASYGGGQLAKVGTYHLSKDVFELTEAQSQSNAHMAELFGTIVTGIALTKPISNAVTNKFSLNANVINQDSIDKIDDSFSKINANVDDVKLREGIWKERGTTRGKEIDGIMGNNLGSNYPVIDRFEDGVATSIKSRDLTAKSYQNGKTLERIIKNDIDELDSFNGKNWGGIRIKQQDIMLKQLDVVVPNVRLTESQINAINNAIKYGNDKNIIIKIVVGGG